jgi:hypothetical protein
MSRLFIDSEIMAVASAVWLRLSRRNGMPDNSHSKTSGEKTMKTRRKTNIFRMGLSTKDSTREKPFVDVSFYLNKTHFFKINYDI